MDPSEASVSGEPNAKDQKPSQNESAAAAAIDIPHASAPNVEQTADIFKLDIDCFDEVFDFLPLKDLLSVGKTCKRLQHVAGRCFQQNDVASANCHDSEIIRTLRGNIVNQFTPFIQTFAINRSGFQFFQSVQSKCHQLKKMFLYNITMTKTDVDRLKKTFSKLEFLSLSYCDLNENDISIIDGCTKLKRLQIVSCQGEHKWVDRKYPMLEYFNWIPIEKEPDVGIPKFLERNPNIRTFSTVATYLWENRVSILTANIKLDELSIKMCYSMVYAGIKLGSFCSLLNELHGRGFYKRLQLSFSVVENQQKIDQLATVNGLVKLSYDYTKNNSYALSALAGLEELFTNSKFINDLESVANDCLNLKLIHFYNARFDNIMPFIRRSVKMRKISIGNLYDGIYFSRDTKIINLKGLNRERERLPDAEKISLYVKEDIYLATKWAMKETDFGLIKMKRIESLN